MAVTATPTTNAIPLNPELTAVAIVYKNPDASLIAEDVLPRTPPGAKKFTWTQYNKESAYTVPDTKVGRKAEPNLVDFGGTTQTDDTVDYGLDDIVPNDDIEAYNAMPKPAIGGPVNPLVISTQFTTGLIQLDREIRVANTVFNAATYPTNNKMTLSGTSQWSDYGYQEVVSGGITYRYYNSDPVDDMLQAIDKMLVRPNTLTLGQQVWTILRQHPKIVQAVFKNLAGAGVVSKEALAELLEIPRILVGAGWVNTARRGQQPNFVRVWGKHAALAYVSDQAAQMGQPCFGFTHQFGTRIAGEIPEPKVGLRGSVRVRVGESVKEVVSAPDTGYFFQNAIA